MTSRARLASVVSIASFLGLSACGGDDMPPPMVDGGYLPDNGPPRCGDGEQFGSEICDDGNSLPGDGCNGICTVENYYECPTPGQPCISTIVCGDGVIGPGEACDDGNTTSGDGCNDGCNTVEVGFRCITPGVECIRVFVCGDGSHDPA